MKRSPDLDSPPPRKRPRLPADLIARIVQEGDSVPDLDERSIILYIQSLEKAICRNQEYRLRYSDEPLKFQASEEELYTAILKFKSLPEDSEALRTVLDSPGLENLIGLLGHANLDIVNTVFEVLLDWCDSESPSAIQNYVIEKFVQGEIVRVVAGVLDRVRVSRDHDSEVIYSALSVLESVFTEKPEETEKAPIVNIAKWIIRQMNESSEKEFSTNKLYTAEILSVLLSHSCNHAVVTDMGGVECLLKTIITHSGCKMEAEDEKELLENLFDSLCRLILHKPALDVFRRIKGISALLLMMR